MRKIIFVVALALVASLAMAQTPIDNHTTFIATYEEGIQPDYCAGDWRAGASGNAELVDGKFGSALFVPDRETVSYNADEKINLSAGTIEFWLLWTEEMTGDEKLSIFGMRTPEANNYVNFNKIAPERLGMPVKQGPPEDDEWTWQRVDVDPTGWETPSWHHFAGVWEGGVTKLYVDGELVDTAEGGAGFVEEPEEFSFGSGPLTVDEVRISSKARAPEEIAALANAEPGVETTMYLTDLEPTAMRQALGRVGIDHYLGIDEREMPLVIGQTAYARGLALRAPGHVEFEVPEGMSVLDGVYGASPLGSEGADVTLTFSLDGQAVQTCSDLSPTDEARDVALPVEPGQTLRIEAQPVEDMPGAVAVVGDAMLMAEGIEPPPSFSRELTPDELTLQQMRTRAAAFNFELPDAPKGYVIYDGHPVDEVDPAVEPLHETFPEALQIAAAPGEYEAAQFSIFADRDLNGINVAVSDLTGDAGEIGAETIEVQLVRRVLMRKGYWMPRLPANYETVSRFIFPNREFWLPESNFKEVYLLTHVPDDAAPGNYSGTVTVSAEGAEPTEMQLRLTVRPIDLIQPTNKRYGFYYRSSWLQERPEEVNDAEFADMAAHGITTIKGHTRINLARDEDGNITWDFDLIRQTLDKGLEHGFFGEVTIYDNLMHLARLMEYSGLNLEGEGEPVSEKEDLLAVAKDCFADLKQLEAEYPQYEFLLTHMDEVFGRGRLPRYLDFARVVTKTSDYRLYITIPYSPGRWEDKMEQADPWIDVRCINGHSLESWLQAGNDWDDMAQHLAEAGDEAWIYHNMRGSFFRAEWNRFINGLFLWVSPIEVHVPWMYYRYGGNPFDDTDAEGFDFGYAFPHPDDPTLLISTLHYEAFREGYDDMRYIRTLEETMKQARAAGVDVSEAQAWLGRIKSMLPQIPEDIEDVDLESPYSVAAQRSFSGADWDAMPDQTARHIMKLQEAMGE